MFFEFGIKDFIDILLVAMILYYIYRLMRESRSLNVFIGILMFVITWLFVSQVVEMKLLGSILDKLVSVGVIALIVLFQDEIRKFLYNVGAHRRMRAFAKLFTSRDVGEDDKKALKEIIMPIVMASMNMSRGKVGALIVIERAMPLDEIAVTGDQIDSNINQRLIENIFFKNSPLHDGAMIVLRLPVVSCRSVTISISQRSWVCDTVLPWAYRKRAMLWPSLYPRKRVVSLSLLKASSICVSRPRNWRVSSPKN